MKNYDTGMMMGGKQAVEFFQNLGSILDDLDIHDSVDEDFSDKYNMAMNRIKYLVRKDIGEPVKVIKKIYGNGIQSINCNHCATKIMEPFWTHCPNCGYTIIQQN